jgi:hypothetical protein
MNAETRQDSPQRSGEYLAKPVIHRPQECLTKFDRASVLIHELGCSARRLPLGYRQKPTLAGDKIDQALDGEL